MNSGNLLAQAFADYGVRYVFGIPGGQTLPLYNGITRTNGKVRHILIRDERSGPYAADAYARVTGRLAACDAVPGPGVIELPSGLAEAYTTAVPLIAIAGDLPREFERYRRYAAAAQGLCDQVELLRPVSKAVIRVQSQIDLRDGINRAFAEATTGRPGPVVLNIPADVMQADWDPLTCRSTRTIGLQFSQRSGPARCRRGASCSRRSRQGKTTCHSGRRRQCSYSRASAEVQRAAERFAAPVASTVTGKGIIDERHPLSVGVLGGQYGEPGANNVVKEADLVFLIGFKSSQQSTYAWNLPRPDQTVIHLDIDPFEVAKVFPTEVCLIGDAALGLMDLIAAADTLGFKPMRNEWLERAAYLRDQWRELATREAVAQRPKFYHNTLCGSLSAWRTPMIFWYPTRASLSAGSRAGFIRNAPAVFASFPAGRRRSVSACQPRSGRRSQLRQTGACFASQETVASPTLWVNLERAGSINCLLCLSS